MLTGISFNWNMYQNPETDAGIQMGDATGAAQGSTTGIQGAQVGFTEGSEKTGDEDKPLNGYRSTPENCKTCRERKYQDGSDDANVSFKTAAHVSPGASAAAVMGHESEHVSHAYQRARLGGGRVLQASVSIHTAICPECGTSYVSGGTTFTAIAYPKDSASITSKRGEGTENFNT